MCTTPLAADTTAPAHTHPDDRHASARDHLDHHHRERRLSGAFTVTVTNGATALAGSTTLGPGATSLVWTSAAQLPWNTALTVAVTASDLAGNAGTLTGTVSTVADPAPDWKLSVAFVPFGTVNYLDKTQAPAGAMTQATFPGQALSGLLPPDCKTSGDDCFKEAARNGTIKFLPTNVRDADPNASSRPLANAFYRTVSTVVLPGTMAYCSLPYFTDTPTPVTGKVNQTMEDFCTQSEMTSINANALGFEVRFKDYGCYQQKIENPLWVFRSMTCTAD